MIASIAAHRQAAGLVALADDGRLDDHTRGLIEQARTNPVRTTELIMVLAETVAALQPERPSEDLDPAYLRKAHAAYAGGCRLPWAIEGERDYRRLKKRNQRARVRKDTAKKDAA